MTAPLAWSSSMAYSGPKPIGLVMNVFPYASPDYTGTESSISFLAIDV